jgi:hypothetical protein
VTERKGIEKLNTLRLILSVIIGYKLYSIKIVNFHLPEAFSIFFLEVHTTVAVGGTDHRIMDL